MPGATRAHERRAAEIVRAAHPGIAITLSSSVAPEIREFERISTACANAYVQPRMLRYLDRLEARLAEMGVDRRAVRHAVGRRHRLRAGGEGLPDPPDRIRPGGRRDGGVVAGEAIRASTT